MSRDDLIEMARLAGCGWAANGTEPMLLGEKQLERFAALVAAHEREECATVCDEVEDQAWRLWRLLADPVEQGCSMGADHCADAIRARGNNEPA